MDEETTKPEHIVVADKTRPYKLYASMLSVALTTLVATAVGLPPWAIISANILINGLAVFLTPNPLEWKELTPVGPDE